MPCTHMYTHSRPRRNRESPGLGTESSLSDGETSGQHFLGDAHCPPAHRGVVHVDQVGSNQVGPRSPDRIGQAEGDGQVDGPF